MVTALNTAAKLDWSGWIRGIVGAIVSGGAGAVSSGLSVNIIDPEHFGITSGLSHLLAVVTTTFCVSALISLAKWLQTHPVPDSEKL